MILFKRLIISFMIMFLLSVNAVCLAEEPVAKDDYGARIAYDRTEPE